MTIFGRPCPARCPTISTVNSLTTVCPSCNCRISVSDLYKPHTTCRQRTKHVIEELEQGLPPGKAHETCHPQDCACAQCYLSIMHALERFWERRQERHHWRPGQYLESLHPGPDIVLERSEERQYWFNRYSRFFNYCSTKTQPIQDLDEWGHRWGAH